MPFIRFLFLFSATLLLSTSAELPRILLIGDSISIGYTPFVQAHLKGRAIVEHNPGNAQHTGTGLAKLDEWIGEKDWDIIHFNWGLWDLCYRHPDSELYGHRDKVNGSLTHTVDQYKVNLDSIVTRLKKLSDAKLIFVTTTYVPPEEAGRFTADPLRYNRAAFSVMEKHGVEVNDIYAYSREVHREHGLGPDDVHFTEAGYAALSRPLATYLEAVLAARRD